LVQREWIATTVSRNFPILAARYPWYSLSFSRNFASSRNTMTVAIISNYYLVCYSQNSYIIKVFLLLIVLNRYSLAFVWFILIRTSFIRQLGSMTDKRHDMVNYVAKCFCDDRLTAVKSCIVLNWIYLASTSLFERLQCKICNDLLL